MSSTLDKLLTIQGATEQQTMPRVMATQTRAAAPPSAAPPPGKAPSETLEVWRTAYKVVTKHAPGIRAAAALGDGDTAANIYTAALAELMPALNAGGDVAIVAAGAYTMLELTWEQVRHGIGAPSPAAPPMAS